MVENENTKGGSANCLSHPKAATGCVECFHFVENSSTLTSYFPATSQPRTLPATKRQEDFGTRSSTGTVSSTMQSLNYLDFVFVHLHLTDSGTVTAEPEPRCNSRLQSSCPSPSSPQTRDTHNHTEKQHYCDATISADDRDESHKLSRSIHPRDSWKA